jgi:hypothetical protein
VPAEIVSCSSRIRAQKSAFVTEQFERFEGLTQAATRALRLLISRAMVPAESASCGPRTLEQTTAFNGRSSPGQFLGGLALVAAQFGDQRDHAGVDAGHQPIGSLPL